jgi:putative endonuclease
MASHNELGVKGETLAVNFLRSKNYNILATNWRWQKAEVDIIAQIENTLVFAEVKTRSSDTFIKPEEAVNEKKQQLLIDAAEAYCEANMIDLELRFDVIAIVHQGSKIITKHIEGAF